jgi:hypothetical protein
LFEDGGANMSGAAGFEMYSLYQAIQHYQLVLDRFYANSPLVWNALSYPVGDFVSPQTVIWYFDKVIRASTQKARAWSEVARFGFRRF